VVWPADTAFAVSIALHPVTPLIGRLGPLLGVIGTLFVEPASDPLTI